MTGLAWPMVRLGELLSPVRGRQTQVDGSVEYPVLGARWYSKGLYIKDRKPGSAVKAATLYRVEEGDFVYNRLFAWKGSFAVAAPEHTGCFVSNEFPCFDVDRDRLDPRFLWLYFSQERIWNAALALSFGATPTSRNRLKEEHLLSMEVPLPSVPEQRRIVAKLELLSSRVQEACRLRDSADRAIRSVWDQIAAREIESLARTSPAVPLGDFVSVRGGGTPSKVEPSYWEGQVPWVTPKDMKRRAISDAIDHISERAIAETPAKLIDPGAVLVVVRGMILAHTFPSAVLLVSATVNQDMKALIPHAGVLPEYLCTVLWAWNREVLRLVEKSTHDTRKLQTDRLLGFRIPLPLLPDQRRVLGRLGVLEATSSRCAAIRAPVGRELGALGPAILDRAFKGDL
ncbi:MAG: restriction endonuclease subunit S [Polyangiaceae bacterium]|nr:restriction endonuclease subunit S [Polyangiaceae bacterium]